MFEIVYTLTDWYDGPRRGIANYNDNPHLFESEWQDGEDLNADTFLLMPIDADTFSLALEDWSIWRRWETAFHQGGADRETHPALPEDRRRHEELDRLLQGRSMLHEYAQPLHRRASYLANVRSRQIHCDHVHRIYQTSFKGV